jgi:aspartyl protease family protein
MGDRCSALRHCMATLLLAAAAAASPALAMDVAVIGLFPGKAVVVVNGGAPRTLAAGQRTPEGVLLVSADSRSATVEVEGRRRVLELGEAITPGAGTDSRASVTLAADSAGHFLSEGQVNGSRVRFLVDTGATFVTLPAADAKRLGIDHRKGQPVVTQTANGRVVSWRVKLDTVSVGTLSINFVDALVHESPGLEVALLGMSFLNRTEMRREGENLTLVKRY